MGAVEGQCGLGAYSRHELRGNNPPIYMSMLGTYLQGYHFFIAMFYVMVGGLVLMVGLSLWVAWCFKSRSFPSVWCVQGLCLCARVPVYERGAAWLAALPFSHILTCGAACLARARNHLPPVHPPDATHTLPLNSAPRPTPRHTPTHPQAHQGAAGVRQPVLPGAGRVHPHAVPGALQLPVSVHVCVCVRVRACVRVCLCVCVRAGPRLCRRSEPSQSGWGRDGWH